MLRRATSPPFGSSSLITSAPRKARIWAQAGPAWLCVMSMMRMPERAWVMSLSRMGAKFPAGREFLRAAGLKAAQTLNERAIPMSRAGNFLPGRRELFSPSQGIIGREFNPVIGNFRKGALPLWSSQEIWRRFANARLFSVPSQVLVASAALRPSRRRFAPPQDEDKFMMALRKSLILRSLRSRRLEGRTVPIQRLADKSKPPRRRAVVMRSRPSPGAGRQEELAVLRVAKIRRGLARPRG